MKFLNIIFASSLFLLGIVSHAIGHELWLDSKKFQVQPGEKIEIELRNGEKFEGINLSFFKNRIQQFFWAQAEDIVPFQSRSGDVPAAKFQVENAGLIIVLYESTPSKITYSDWHKFVSFAQHKDLGDVLNRHTTKGWPQKDFSEIYHRYSKALIGVGHAKGHDRRFGLETEFVALENPYTAILKGSLQVQLLYQGSPRTDAQIEVFERDSESEVTAYLLRTDATGIVEVPVKSGYEYLLDSVVLREFKGNAKDGPLWESLWAALTFSIPKK